MKYLLSVLLLLPLIGVSQTRDVEMLEEKTKDGVIISVVNNLAEQSIDVVLELTSEGFGLKPTETYQLTIEPKTTEQIVQLVAKSNVKYSYASSLSYKTTPVERVIEQRTSKTKTETVDKNKSGNPKATMSKNALPKNKVAKEDHTLKGKKGIVVYSKTGCGRCDYVTSYLKENNIPFQDLNISSDKEADQQMSKVLFASGFKGGSFTTPLITVDDKAHYNIKDLKSFVAKLK